jgi:hypothetical protein
VPAVGLLVDGAALGVEQPGADGSAPEYSPVDARRVLRVDADRLPAGLDREQVQDLAAVGVALRGARKSRGVGGRK